MSFTVTRAFVDAPWLATVLWIVLHALDWMLTIEGARLRARVLERAGVPAASDYELNPIFRGDVARLRFWSPRFLVSWIAVAALMAFIFAMLRAMGNAGGADAVAIEWVGGLLLGSLVFPRVAVIGRHLRNIYLFSRLLREPLPRAPTQLDRATNLRLSALMLLESAAIVGVAALLTADPWAVGGTFALLFVAAKHFFLALVAPRPQGSQLPLTQ